MNDYKVNYNKIMNLKQINYFIFIVVILIMILIIIFIISVKDMNKKISVYGIYENNYLKIELNKNLSDIILKNNHFYINDIKTNYVISSYGDYVIDNNNIYQDLYLIIDKELHNNEIVLIDIYYDNKKIINHILDLFL